MRMKPHLGVVWGLVSLGSFRPSPQGSWRTDHLGHSTGVRSQSVPSDSALPWVFPGEPCALVSRLEPHFWPAVLCILLWTVGSACRGTDQSDAPPCLTQSVPTLRRFLTQNTRTTAALSPWGVTSGREVRTPPHPHWLPPPENQQFSNLLVTRVWFSTETTGRWASPVAQLKVHLLLHHYFFFTPGWLR